MKYYLYTVICIFCSLQLFAQTNAWTGATNQRWDNPSNWDLGHVPVDSENVVINFGICQISANNGLHRIRSLDINGSATFYLNTGSVLIIRDTDPNLNRAGLDISSDATANIWGKLDIADVNGNLNDGIRCYGNMDIRGIINIDDTPDKGISFFQSPTDTATVMIHPTARVNIKNVREGIYINDASTGLATFINEGKINIDSTSNVAGVNVAGGYVVNRGEITITNSPSSIYCFMNDGDTMINEACGVIRVYDKFLTSGPKGITNNGYIYQDIPGALGNGIRMLNNGFIQHNLDSFVLISASYVVENNGYILGTPNAQYYVGVPISPALEGLGQGLTIIGNQFYSDATLTAAAGPFDPMTNTWTPNSTAEGISEFYMRVQTDANCPRVMKISYENPIAIQSTTGSNTACDISNGKPTNQEVSGNACVDGVVNVSEAFQLTPVMTPPTNPGLGYIYMDGTTNTLRYWNGGAWVIVQ